MAKTPNYTVKVRKLEDYTPDTANANQGSERGSKMLEDSLSNVGFGRSIVVDAQDRIIAGNKTSESAMDVGITEVIEIETDGNVIISHKRRDMDLAESDPAKNKARELAYRDNRVSEVSMTWNPEQIALDLQQGYKFLETQLFTPEELSIILEPMPALDDYSTPDDEEQTPSPTEELQQKWNVQVGQLWRIPSVHHGEHFILCDDCTNVTTIDRIKVPTMTLFTDPPYGIDMEGGFGDGGTVRFGKEGKQIPRRKYDDTWDDTRPTQETFQSLLSVNDKAFIFGGNYFADILPPSTHWVVWDKLNTMPSYSDCELIWTNIERKSVHKFTFEYNGLIGREQARFHPTQKPVGLLVLLLNEYTNEKEVLFDPYCGSGTTMVACEQTNRLCRGIEREPKYVAVTLERMSQLGLTPQLVE